MLGRAPLKAKRRALPARYDGGDRIRVGLEKVIRIRIEVRIRTSYRARTRARIMISAYQGGD